MSLAGDKFSFLKKSLFWDVDIENLSIEKDWFFIIERVLEFGDIQDFKCLLSIFSKDQIKSVIKNSRILSPRTISFCRAIGYAS
ncbi:MAG: DUF6922 domain-containing protein [Thermodesulfovibrionales bacterium]